MTEEAEGVKYRNVDWRSLIIIMPLIGKGCVRVVNKKIIGLYSFACCYVTYSCAYSESAHIYSKCSQAYLVIALYVHVTRLTQKPLVRRSVILPKHFQTTQLQRLLAH